MGKKRDLQFTSRLPHPHLKVLLAKSRTQFSKDFNLWRTEYDRMRQKDRMRLNSPFPTSKNCHFQNEAKCETFLGLLVIMAFICIRIKMILSTALLQLA